MVATKLVRCRVRRDGTTAVTGNGSVLKKSQAYPRGFGTATATLYDDFQTTIQEQADRVLRAADAIDFDVGELLGMSEDDANEDTARTPST
eukprot:10242069-Alexandrium_andersonii.AAC.1